MHGVVFIALAAEDVEVAAEFDVPLGVVVDWIDP